MEVNDDNSGEWYPIGRIDFVALYEMLWKRKVWLGEEGDIGRKFEIATVLVNKTDAKFSGT
jgi:hypothetical protein